MTSVLLDSTVLIDILRGRQGAIARLDRLRNRGDHAWTSAINVEEIVRGLLPGEGDGARALFLGLRIAPLGRDEGWRAGEWRQELSRRGRTVSQADCLVAAAAVAIDARLATGNPADFPMPDLTVEHWPVGE
jgi:predicted nucleic acid-binding protein